MPSSAVLVAISSLRPGAWGTARQGGGGGQLRPFTLRKTLPCSLPEDRAPGGWRYRSGA